jgi:hypothetical protein
VFKNELVHDVDTIMQTKVPIECKGLKCGFDHQNMFVFDNHEHTDGAPSWLVIPPWTDPY